MRGSGTGGKGRFRSAVLIAGPTASGKSALALRLAEDMGAVIVNADSMQVYSVLEVLTARPGPAELARAPHHLYGHVSPSVSYSTGAWLRDVETLAAGGAIGEAPAVFVGGTGLYFRALTEGLPDMPDIPAAIRDGWRSRLHGEGAPSLHRVLAERDPETAAGLKPGDGQRIVRALEVLEASGRPIRHWQAERTRPLVDIQRARCLVLMPGRADLIDRIERRFDGMIAAGALEEVRQLEAMNLDPALPAMKAIGVPELRDALAGRLSLAQAVERAKAATRQYAKRQSTWFRHQLGPMWRRFDPSDLPQGSDD